MTSLRLAPGLAQDVQRIAAHLRAQDIADTEQRVAEIFDALALLIQHPLIGRPTAVRGQRELVIGKGARGYVARYHYNLLDDVVSVLALRGQREAGFVDR